MSVEKESEERGVCQAAVALLLLHPPTPLALHKAHAKGGICGIKVIVLNIFNVVFFCGYLFLSIAIGTYKGANAVGAK